MTTAPTTLLGCDSAEAPSMAACHAAVTAGVKVWQVYVGGPNATHTYTEGETAVLRGAGLTPVAIWVPSFSLTENVDQAAADAVGAMEARGVYGALCLDTEYQMRTAPNLRDWVDGWCARVPSPSVYTGGGYTPPGVRSIWLNWGGSLLPIDGNGTQYGPASAFGMSVDWDRYSPAFPFSRWTPAATVAPAPAKPAPAPATAPRIVAMVGRPQGDGYWLVGANGGLHAYGKADGALARVEHDRLPGSHLPSPIVSAIATPTGQGLHLSSAAGDVYRLGDALNLDHDRSK